MAQEITIAFTDEQFDFIEGLAISQIRTIPQMLSILIAEGFLWYDEEHQIYVRKKEKYFTEEEKTKLDSHGYPVYYKPSESRNIFDSIKLNVIYPPQ